MLHTSTAACCAARLAWNCASVSVAQKPLDDGSAAHAPLSGQCSMCHDDGRGVEKPEEIGRDGSTARRARTRSLVYATMSAVPKHCSTASQCGGGRLSSRLSSLPSSHSSSDLRALYRDAKSEKY